MTHTPSYRRMLHKLGYYDYQRGLVYRHLNQDAGWFGHEKNSRNFILRAVNLLKPEKITILGSGWLLDLPVAELAERSMQIRLVDIFHPPEVRSQTAGFRNLELVEEDITGGLIEEVWKKAGKSTFLNRMTTLKEIIIPDYEPADSPGMVISLNILTQLEVLPLTFLRKKTRADKNEFEIFRQQVQKKHLDFLRRHTSLLLTDTAEKITHSSGIVSEIPSVVIDLPAGRLRENWQWDFDLKGIDYNRKRSVMEVTGIIL